MAQKKKDQFSKFRDLFSLNFSGLVGGLIFYCLSFTPSLLPRGYVLQGVVTGLSFASGYGLGVLISWLFYKLPKKYRFRLNLLTKRLLIAFLIVASVAAMILGFNWQQQVRKVVEAEPASANYPFRIIIIAVILAYLLIWLGRGIRRLSRFFSKQLNRLLPHKVSMYGGAILATIFLIFLINGVLLKALFGFINFSFGLANQSTPAGIYQPQTSLFSGSPDSAIDWNSLGEKGREFVATTPTDKSIAKFSGKAKAAQPSRLYVGLESADTLQDRVNLLINELNRTKAAERSAVLIAIPTGSGGINAKSVQSVEYLYNGNTSTLGIQYSYLPSWLSFVADQDIARETGKTLTEAVFNWWNHLNTASRPKLLMYGESLGTLGADGAFSGASDMYSRMNGVMLVGPPNANILWKNMVANRDEGTRQVLPTYQHGEAVRFSDGLDFFTDPKNQVWQDHRIGIFQNASDPVVWASTSLFFHEPEWLEEPRGSDVLPNMHWYPLVTAWQVGFDLPFAFGATSGHGHRYGDDLAAGWTAILNMKLTPQKSSQLQQIIDAVKG